MSAHVQAKKSISSHLSTLADFAIEMFDVLDEINYQSYNDFVLRVGMWLRAVPSFGPAHPSCTGPGSWWPGLSPGSGGHRSRLPCLTGRRMVPPRGVHGTQGQLGPPQSWLSVTEDLEESLCSLGNAGEILIVLETLRYTSESTLSWRKVPLSAGPKHWGRGWQKPRVQAQAGSLVLLGSLPCLRVKRGTTRGLSSALALSDL